MKKLVALLMIMLFGFSSSGATVQLHYCCGELKSVSFGSVQEQACGMDADMNGEPCCETKSVGGKQQDHELYNITFGSAAPVEAPVYYVPMQQKPFTLPVLQQPVIAASPQLPGDIFLLNCVFRI